MRTVTLIVSIVALSGCFGGLFYTGDGDFTDNGILNYSRRYVVDLGPVDLSAPRIYTYRLSSLPNARFNVAIQVVEEKQNEWDVRPEYPATVRLRLFTETSEAVILEEGQLDSWVRGFGAHDNISELYQRGETRDIPLPGGGARPERLGVRASGGWGTYFDSKHDQTYALTLEILSSSMRRPAHLVLNGWDE
jgi:hypothetical protein